MSPTMVDNRIMALINKFAKMASVKWYWVWPVLSFNKRVGFIKFRDQPSIFPHGFVDQISLFSKLMANSVYKKTWV